MLIGLFRFIIGVFKKDHPSRKKEKKIQRDAPLTELFPPVPDGITFESTYLKVYIEAIYAKR